MKQRNFHSRLPVINASSMADIAFLLLIFFLVTTEIKIDEGIMVKLPGEVEKQEELNKEVLNVRINAKDELLVEQQYVKWENLREQVKTFVTNNGRRKDWSTSPQRAIISLNGDRGTSYEMYINVYNELLGAYRELRDEKSQELYGRTFSELSDPAQKQHIKDRYPVRISEAEPVEL